MRNRLTKPLIFVKANERYIFRYDGASTSALLQTINRFASQPDLALNQFDAAVLSRVVREESAVAR